MNNELFHRRTTHLHKIIDVPSVVWESSPDDIKFDLGNNIENHIVNLDKEKQELGEVFFEYCKGNSYKPNSRKSLELTWLIKDLIDKHYGWDNFHHEKPVIKNKVLF